MVEPKPIEQSGDVSRLELERIARERGVVANGALANARRVAIITKCRFMGDTIVTIPFINQLRRQFPKTHITLFTSPSAAVALANCPALNAIQPITYTPKPSELRGGDFDVAFVVDRSLKSGVWTWMSGIKTRIGFDSEHRRALLSVPIPYGFNRNEVDSHLDMLRVLGIQAEMTVPELWLTDSEKKEAHDLLSRSGWDGKQLVIGIQPGANDPHIREWGNERFSRVLDVLAAKTGAFTVVMGGGTEIGTAQRLESLVRHSHINFAGQLELRQALAVVGRCNLWLGNDTGLLHAAVAQSVSTVGIFGPNKAHRWGYQTLKNRSLVHIPAQAANTDSEVRHCIDAITEDEVLESAFEVLKYVNQPLPSDQPQFALQPIPNQLAFRRR